MNANAKIFIANLSPSATEDDLRRVFGAHGTVMEADLLLDRVSGQPRGLAFITMKSGAEAQMAMNGLNGTDLAGWALALNLAKPRRTSLKVGRRRHTGVHKRGSWRRGTV
jgi:cold-inducible RNA-binding protein